LPDLCRAFGGLPDAAWRVKQSASPPTGGAQEPKEALMSHLAHTAVSTVNVSVRRRVLVWLAASIALAAVTTVLLVVLISGGGNSTSSVSQPSSAALDRAPGVRFDGGPQEGTRGIVQSSVIAPRQSGPERATFDRSVQSSLSVPRQSGPERAASDRSPSYPAPASNSGPEDAAFDR
jgi:hypothetical protein